MFSVGKLGGYISRGVYTVSGTFYPFGGAVDIIVVEQPDGTFKSSPWHVRFGKFQGVLKAVERVVSINVNGADANFHMYLDNKGEAFFLQEVDVAKGESNPYPSSEDEMVLNFEVSDRKVKPQISSPRARMFGLSFGKRSMKKNGFEEGQGVVGVDRASSLERAEIAADLLEVRWSGWTTNLTTTKNGNVISPEPEVSCPKLPVSEVKVEDDSTGVDNGAVDNEKNAWSNTSEFAEFDMSVSCTLGSDKNDGPFSFGEHEPVLSGMDKKKSSADNGSCNGDEKVLCHIAQVQLAGNIDMPPVGKKEVYKEVFSDEVLNLNSSTIVDTSNCSRSSNNELRSENLCSCSSDLDSLPRVLEERSIVHMESQPFCLSANSIHEKNTNATPSENSDDQLFSFSDLDDPKADKVEGIEDLSPDGLKESIEDELSETFIMDDKSNQITDKPLEDDLLINHPIPTEMPISETSPISISEVYENADLEFLVPVVESLPNMPLAGNNINPYGIPEQISRSLNPKLEALELATNDVSVSLESVAAQQQQVAHEKLATNSSQISEEIKKNISDPAVEVSLCGHLLYEGMGYEAAALAFDAKKLDKDKFISLCPDIARDDKLVVRIGGLYFPWVAALPIAAAIGSQGREQILEPKGMIAVGQVNETSKQVLESPIKSRNGSWRILPFAFKRINSVREKNLESEMALDNPIQMNRNTDEARSKAKKKKIWSKSPTSEQLASLKLKEGKNVVIFTFFTAMLGNQQVDARIFLWKWNTKIVISDVDGTITKSDVLGQFMPLMGIDWSHPGVTNLFSAVKENGYHFLFLSARSISQAYHTRQFLVNLRQDGKALPEGPIVISPDGLFPSLYREVIRRAPHEFKISCLEGIKALFPRDHNPFYAGFGNRDTDELSYLKIGIPKGKIFTINPKGEVVVNRLVDTTSYPSLHTLVHNMFPLTAVTEQENYNSWNFWRLPPPIVNIR